MWDFRVRKTAWKTIYVHPIFWCFLFHSYKKTTSSVFCHWCQTSFWICIVTACEKKFCIVPCFKKASNKASEVRSALWGKRGSPYMKSEMMLQFPQAAARPCRDHSSETPGLRELLPPSFPSSIILIISWLTLPHQSQASLPLAQTSYNTLEEDEGIS